LLSGIELKYPINVLFAALAVFSLLFFVLAFRKKKGIMTAMSLDYRPRFQALRSALIAAGLGLIVFSLMGPQRFSGYAQIRKTGMDIYVLMDTSKSMLVSDVAPDRLTHAKKFVENLLDNLEGDRIGFIPFASDAYIQMPLTDDYQLARMFLDVIDTDMIGGGGTNIAAAIRLAAASFDRVSGSDMVILILSDGEEHDSESARTLDSVKNDRLKVFTVGVGTEKGGLVPIYNSSGSSIIDYMKDRDGNPVTSRLNADTLARLARDGQGAYYHAGAGADATAALMKDMLSLKRDERKQEQVKMFSPLYQYFLGPGVLLFVIAWFWPERRLVS